MKIRIVQVCLYGVLLVNTTLFGMSEKKKPSLNIDTTRSKTSAYVVEANFDPENLEHRQVIIRFWKKSEPKMMIDYNYLDNMIRKYFYEIGSVDPKKYHWRKKIEAEKYDATLVTNLRQVIDGWKERTCSYYYAINFDQDGTILDAIAKCIGVYFDCGGLFSKRILTEGVEVDAELLRQAPTLLMMIKKDLDVFEQKPENQQ